MIRPTAAMDEVTELLRRWGRGDLEAFNALVPQVYEELHRLAEHYLRLERATHTLQPTALVNECYMRLSGLREVWLQNRTHFYGAAAGVMRRVLVDHARRRNAEKRGGGDAAPSVDAGFDVLDGSGLDLEALDGALEALARVAPEKARVVELRFFGGLSVEETAAFLDVSPVTVKRYWKFARAWLYRELAGRAEPVGRPPAPGISS
jgi:RNA polymerase sigma factor (TIGR02999 family)